MAEGDGLALGEGLGYERVQESVGVWARVPVEGVGPVTVQERVRVTVPREGVWEGGLGVRVLTVVVREAERVQVVVAPGVGVRDELAEREAEGGEGVGVAEGVRRPVTEPEAEAEREALGVGVGVRLGVAVRDVGVREAEPVEGEAEGVGLNEAQTVRLALATAVQDPDALWVGVQVREAVGAREGVTERERVGRVRVRVRVRETVGVPLAEAAAEAVGVGLPEREREPVVLRDADQEGLRDAEGHVAVRVLGLIDAVPVRVRVPEWVTVRVGVTVALMLVLPEGDAVDWEAVALRVGVAEGPDGVHARVPLGVGLVVAVCDALAVGRDVQVPVAEVVRVALWEALAETATLFVAELYVSVHVAEGVAVAALEVGVAVALSLSLGVG